jgi:hypothetical protein
VSRAGAARRGGARAHRTRRARVLAVAIAWPNPGLRCVGLRDWQRDTLLLYYFMEAGHEAAAAAQADRVRQLEAAGQGEQADANDAEIVDGQAADVDALEPSQALAGTAWEVLERTGTLCLVLDGVDAGDVFAAALVCKPFHASLVQRWPIWRPPLLLRQCPARTPMVIIATHIDDFEDDAGEPCPCQSTGHHFRTSVRDLALSTSRLEWAQKLYKRNVHETARGLVRRGAGGHNRPKAPRPH